MSEEYKHRAKKRFGQNFLTDEFILDKIADAAALTPQDTVLEIGMGTGVLTRVLAQKAGKVITVEIDHELFPETKAKLEQHMNVSFILGDFLEKADKIFSELNERIKVVANIPYYITTPIIEKLFVYADKIDTITLMVQKEVAQRITARPSTKDYGSLTVFVRYNCEPIFVCDVLRHCFRPIPNVDSAVIQLKIHREKPYRPFVEKRFFNIVNGSFWGRRKTLRNTLKQSPYTHYTKEMLEKLERETRIDLQRRGETLSMEEFVALSNVEF